MLSLIKTHLVVQEEKRLQAFMERIKKNNNTNYLPFVL